MRATKYILTLLFVVTLAVSAFAWTVVETTSYPFNDIDGISTTNLTTLCAVGYIGTVEVSTDYGQTWSLKTSPLTNIPLYAVSLIANKIFVAGGSLSTGGGRAFVSIDNGASWSPITPTLATTFEVIHDIEFVDASNGIVTGKLVDGNYGCKYTDDGGANWNDSAGLNLTHEHFAVTFADADNAFVAGNNASIYKSQDKGANWTQKNTSTGIVLSGINFVDIINGYAAGGKDSGDPYVYKTTDNGESWDLVTTPETDTVLHDICFVDANTGWTVGDHGPNDVAAIFSTTDGGSSWLKDSTTTGLDNTQVKGVFFFDADNGWAVRAGSGMILSEISSITLLSVVQSARTSQHQAYRGFFGDLTFAGENFQRGAWATGDINFAAAGITVQSVTWVDSTQLTVNITISGTAALGIDNVSVTNIDGSSDTLTSGFTVTEKPTITGISPGTGIVGATVTGVQIDGKNFQAGIGDSNINFGANITVSNTFRINAQHLTCDITIDSGATAGPRNVYVTNPDGGTSNASSFGVSSGASHPTVSSFTPDTVPVNTTGRLITIEGTDFHSSATAEFETDGITITNIDYISSVKLEIIIDISASAPTDHPRSIIITNVNDGGVGSSGDSGVYFYVTADGAIKPDITDLLPSSGFENTAVNLSVNGSSFESGATIQFWPSDGIIINSYNYSFVPNKIILDISIGANATTPTATRDVTVTNPTGGHNSLLSAFTIKQQSSEPSVEKDRGLIWPSPWNPGKGSVDIQFNIDKDDIVDLHIFTIDGKPVKSFIGVSFTAGVNTITWDGIDTRGHQMPAGTALGELVSQTEGRVLAKVLIMIVPWQ